MIENQLKVTRSLSSTTEACDLKAIVLDGLLNNINAGPLQFALNLLIHVSLKYTALVRGTCYGQRKRKIHTNETINEDKKPSLLWFNIKF